MAPRIHLIPGDVSVVISAPHGHDRGTAHLAHEVCRATGFAGICVGDAEDPMTGERLNINRPTEGAGLDPWEEIPSPRAIEAYVSYRSALDELLAGAPLRGYVEIHDNDTQKNAELALMGVPVELLRPLKLLWRGPMPLLVDGIDMIRMKALPSKWFGTLPDAEMALHFELPTSWKEHPAETARAISSLVSRFF